MCVTFEFCSPAVGNSCETVASSLKWNHHQVEIACIRILGNPSTDPKYFVLARGVVRYSFVCWLIRLEKGKVMLNYS